MIKEGGQVARTAVMHVTLWLENQNWSKNLEKVGSGRWTWSIYIWIKHDLCGQLHSEVSE